MILILSNTPITPLYHPAIIIFNTTLTTFTTYYINIIQYQNYLRIILLVLYLQKQSHTAHSNPTHDTTKITYMATLPQSPLSICRREHPPSHQDSNSSNSHQVKDEETCSCCCCINYNFFTLGLRYALNNQNFGLALTPQLISSYLQLNGENIKEEDIKEVQRQGLKSGQFLQTNANQNEIMNENQVFKYNHTIKKNSLIKKESTISIKKENKNKIEYNIGENNQNRIFKINNLGQQSELNSSPLQNIHDQQHEYVHNEAHEHIHNDEEIPVNLQQIERNLKLVETNKLKQEQSDNSIGSSQQACFSPLQQHIEDNDIPMQEAVEVRKQQQQQIKQSDDSNSYDQSYSEDSQQPNDPSIIVQKQQPYIQNRKLEEDNQADPVQQRSIQEQPVSNISYGMQFEQAKNQQRSNQFYITKSIKEQLLEKLNKQHHHLHHRRQYSKQHSQNQQSANEQPSSEAFYPYSQPQRRYDDPQMMSNHHIYSLHQNFQYNHAQIQAQKSRKSRYSKKLDQELQSEQRKQHTQIQSLNQKIQKLQYNSQSNLPNHFKIYESQRQSLPLPECNLKRQQDERDIKKERQLPDQLNLPRLFTTHPTYFNNRQIDAVSDTEKKQQEEQIFSAALFSEDELESPADQIVLKKQEENQQQQDSAYAVISIEQQIKQQNFQLPVQIKKREEEIDTPIQNIQYDSKRVYMEIFDKIGDLSSIKKQIEDNTPHHHNQQQQVIDAFVESKIEQKQYQHSDSSQNGQSQPQNQPSRGYNKNDRVVSEPEEQSDPQPMHQSSQSIQQQQIPLPILPNPDFTQKQHFKEQQEQIQDLSDDEDPQEAESDKQQQQKSTQKKNTVPRISKKMAIELKRQSKHERQSEQEQQNENQSEPQKQPKLAISKSIELNINQSHSINIDLKELDPEQQQVKLRKQQNIHISNQFSFYQSGGSEVYSQKKSKKKKKKKTEYIRKQDYDPHKYQEIQEVYYKVARKSKPKHKKKIVEQIYEVPSRKASTKKLARDYARQKYESRKDRSLLSQSYSQIEQIQVSQQSQYSSNHSQIFEYPRPPSRSKRHKQKIRYVYIDQPVYHSRKKSKYSRIVDEEQPSVSKESSSQMRTKKKHRFGKH